MSSEERDELDRLYARLEWENPREKFTQRVMARVQWAERAQRISMALTLVALALLGVFGFALGRGLTISGAFDYAGLVFDNVDLVTNAADDFIAALSDVVPWLNLLAVALGLVCVWVAAVLLPRWLARRGGRVSQDV